MENHLKEMNTHGDLFFPLQVYSHKDKNESYFVSQHWHSELEFLFVEYGDLEVAVNGNRFVLAGGQCCFINSGELHEINAIGPSYHHAVIFQPKILDFAYFDGVQQSLIQPITSGKLLFPAVLADCQHQEAILIRNFLKNIVLAYQSGTFLSQLSVKIQLLQIIEFFYQKKLFYSNPISNEEAASLEHIKEVILYINQHYSQKISLTELSEIACMSPTYFCRYFKKRTGKSPVTFINEYRIQKAAEMICSTEQPLIDIAFNCGFDNFSYFIKKFKDLKGITPKQLQIKTME